VVRGSGKQGQASIYQSIGYWLLGIPLACVCVFILNLGLFGLWMGPVIAITFICAGLSMLIYRIEWNVEIKNERKRRADENKKLKEIEEKNVKDNFKLQNDDD